MKSISLKIIEHEVPAIEIGEENVGGKRLADKEDPYWVL